MRANTSMLFSGMPMFRLFLLYLLGFGMEQLGHSLNLNYLISGGVFFLIVSLIFKLLGIDPLHNKLRIWVLCALLVISGGVGSSRTHSSNKVDFQVNQLIASVTRNGNSADTTTIHRNGIVQVSYVYDLGIWRKVDYKIWLQLPLKSELIFKNGHTYLIKARISSIEINESNSFDFWLLKNDIHHKAYAESIEFQKYKINSESLIDRISHRAIGFRKKLLNLWDKEGSGRNEHALFSALILGDRSAVSNEMLQAFSGSGIIHLLAVSGLHVGLIYAALLFLVFKIGRFRENSLFRLIFILIGLWCYAFMTGLSPSVLRASSMFSFHAIASLLKRRVSTFNLLSTVAMFMLFVKPQLIFHIGFQLSFFAVWGIIAFEPFTQFITSALPKRFRSLGQAVGISCSAQLATIPLTLYYFNSFPVYFLPANLIAVPLATLITYFGLAGMFLINIPILNTIVIELTGFLLRSLIFLAEFTSELPKAVYTGVYSNPLLLIMGLTLLTLIRLLIIYKSGYLIKSIMGIIFLISLFSLIGRVQRAGDVQIYSLSNGLIVKRFGVYSNEAWLIHQSKESKSQSLLMRELVKEGFSKSRIYRLQSKNLDKGFYCIQLNEGIKLSLEINKSRFRNKYIVKVYNQQGVVKEVVMNEFINKTSG